MLPNFKTQWPKVSGALLIAHFIEALGREETFWELILQPYYFRDVASGFVIALTIWEFISRISNYLDARLGWFERPLERILLQFGCGVVVASFFMYILVGLQFKFIFGESILAGEWLLYEFPVAVVFIIFVNIIYFTTYVYSRSVQFEKMAYARSVAPGSIEHDPLHDIGILKKDLVTEIILARKGLRQCSLKPEDIAYIFRDDTTNHIKTFQSEVYTIDETLDELEKKLNKDQFFRANRQMLVNRLASESFVPASYGKLEVYLQPSVNHPVIISQKRAPEFKAWMKGRAVSNF
jgi:hypothetical protein